MKAIFCYFSGVTFHDSEQTKKFMNIKFRNKKRNSLSFVCYKSNDYIYDSTANFFPNCKQTLHSVHLQSLLWHFRSYSRALDATTKYWSLANSQPTVRFLALNLKKVSCKQKNAFIYINTWFIYVCLNVYKKRPSNQGLWSIEAIFFAWLFNAIDYCDLVQTFFLLNNVSFG